MASADVATTLSAFNNTKLFIHSQKDEFFRRGVSVKSAADDTKSEDGRTTRVIDPTTNDVNPLELDADIAHFKALPFQEHFSHMKWMYLEQETKEAYLRAILCDPPEVIEQKDNDELETRNAAAKAKLKAKKRQVEGLCAEVSALVKEAANEYTYLSDKSTEATRQLAEIEQMKFTITDLKNAQEQDNTDQNLPLPASLALLSRHKAKRDHLAIALEKQTQENARKRREVEKLRVQLEELERNRVDVEMFAREAERSQSAESAQEEMACKKQVGWWLKAMTAAQMEFLGLTEFSLDERTEVVRMVLYVNNVGDVPIQIQLKDRKFDSAKVAYKAPLRIDDIVKETRKRGGDIPFFLEQLKLEITPKSR